MRYFLELAYQGTHYHGWQVQPNATTVQGVIQSGLATLLRREVKIVGSSRTDTGVHARQQFAHVDLTTPAEAAQLSYRLNALLPPDIALVGLRPVQPTAHARFAALNRTYHYTVVPQKAPFQRETSYRLSRRLEVAQMNQAAALLQGEKDFQGFCKAHAGVAHYRCTVLEAAWEAQAGQLVFCIRANRFLRGMVRFIVSHLLQVGMGQLSVADFAALLDQQARHPGAALVPAQGLTLAAVAYPASIFLA